MLDFPRWKVIWLWFVTLICVVAAIPSLTSTMGLGWPSSLPEPKINLGLDLAGGSHILLEADPSQVRLQRIEGMEESVRNKLKQDGQKAGREIRISDISNRDGALTFVVADATQVDAVRE
ncbi:MAG TPA: protein translocase subunit SecD, partial [Novosphingobium sp.]|nr:protein translocase subunit SecD [Novosphingobium sp.]